MTTSIYIIENNWPFEKKQFSLVLREFNGIETDHAVLLRCGIQTAEAIVRTGQIFWNHARSDLVKCLNCGQMLTKPCKKMFEIEDRAKIFPSSDCVGALARYETLKD